MTFDVDRFVGRSPFRPCRVFRRGEPRFPKTPPRGPLNQSSGFNVGVSDASWSDLAAQVADAERFLRKHASEIRRLVRFSGVEGVVLDFPVELRTKDGVAAHFNHLPCSLVGIAGRLGVALELSVYSFAPWQRSNRRLQRAALKRRGTAGRKSAAAEPRRR